MSNTPTSVMLFAAGFGTRMGGLTKDRPKPMIPVAGQMLIDRALDKIDEAGLSNVVVNLHYKAPMLAEHLKNRSVMISDETDHVLETGGGLRKALPLLGTGPVFTFNPDAVWTGPNPLSQLQAAWDPEKMDALLLLVPKSRALGHLGKGDFHLSDRGSDCGTIHFAPEHIYTGAQIIKTEGLADIHQSKFSLLLLWQQLIAKNRIYGLLHPGGWCDVGRPEGITIAESMLEQAHV